jgi:hypothetical protein
MVVANASGGRTLSRTERIDHRTLKTAIISIIVILETLAVVRSQ